MMANTLLGFAARPFKALFVSDALGGVLLIAVALAAVAVANSPWAGPYHHLLNDPLAWSPIDRLPTIHAWINDGLMAIFFFVVGLEVKREVVKGDLADPAVRRLPILSAVAGMVVPAVVYLAIAWDHPTLLRGWAIPSATDIAFAMGVVGLLGTRVPAPLRTFLLTVATVDDIGAVAIIALAYTAQIALAWLLASAAVLVGLVALNRLKVSGAGPYLAGALVLWVCVLHSGIHPTIAGVAAALTVPLSGERSVGEAIERALVPWNAYLIVPLFGFANAGVSLAGLNLAAAFAPLPLAVGAGLLVGKQLGIFASVYLADRFGVARRPNGVTWLQVWGIALLCGIGFTMSLFIGSLAFPHAPDLVEEAKLGVLGGSLLSAALGYAVLRVARPVNPSPLLADSRPSPRTTPPPGH